MLIPQLKKILFFEVRSALSGWKTVKFYRVKEIYDKRYNKVMEFLIQNNAQPLYIADPDFFYITESTHTCEVLVDATWFDGMADQDEQWVDEDQERGSVGAIIFI